MNSGDPALIGQYEELGRLRQEISQRQQNNASPEVIQDLETQAEALDKSLTQSSAAFRDLKADLETGWQDVLARLQPGEAAIEFAAFRVYDKRWTNRTLYAALVLKPGMEAPAWVPLCEGWELERQFARAEDMVKEVKDTLKDQTRIRILYDQYGDELYTAVWQPLKTELEGVTAIYYSPAGLLHKVSFEALPVDGDPDKRLGDTYDLNLVSSTREVARRNNGSGGISSAVIYGGLLYTGSAANIQRAAQPYRTADEKTGSRIAYTPPSNTLRGGSLWIQLPGTIQEALLLEGQLNRRNIPTTLYRDNEGNEESFKALDGRKTTLIHLATHGFFLEDIEKKAEERELIQRLGGGARRAAENPLLRSGLILAGGNFAWSNNPVEGVEDGIVTADEIAGLNLTGTELVVLSACQTGLGDVNNGEGVLGLQRAFKLAGVETLIMSLWEVNDQATAELMTVFYEEWLSGKGKQEAFKEARKQVRAQYPAPFYWAAFVMMD
jgi:CHAT domain-containing protein